MAEAVQTETTNQTVTVRSNGTKKEVLWVSGMTVQQAIDTAHIRTKWNSKYFVDGQRTRGYQLVQPGQVITISPPIRNG